MCERENEKGVTIKGSFIVTLFESKLVFMTVFFFKKKRRYHKFMFS